MTDGELDYPPRRSLGEECRIRQEESGVDMVNHPPHYGDGDYEAIKVIEAWELNYRLGNCVKYVARHRKKSDPLEDLKKARWYLDREIQHMEAFGTPQFMRRDDAQKLEKLEKLEKLVWTSQLGAPSPLVWQAPVQGDLMMHDSRVWRWSVLSNGSGKWTEDNPGPDRAGPPTPK